MIRSLFLDFDGTLCDSLSGLRSAYRRFLADFGVTGSDVEFDSLNGPPLPRIVAELQAIHKLPGDQSGLMARYIALAREAHDSAPPAEDAEIILAEAVRLGWRVAIVTSNGSEPTRAWLSRQGLSDLVSSVVGGDDVVNGKPHAEPYLEAIRRTGASPADSLAVEDGEQGAQAALSAGLPLWLIAPVAPDSIKRHPLLRGTLAKLRDIREHLGS